MAKAKRVTRAAFRAKEAAQQDEIARQVEGLAARLSKEDIARRMIEACKANSRLQREIFEARKGYNKLSDDLDKYREIAQAVNLLASYRAARDRLAPKRRVRGDEPLFGIEADEPERLTTHPRALTEILDNLDETLDAIGGMDEIEKGIREDVESQIEPLMAERNAMLAMLGIDEHEWRAKHYWRAS